MRARRAVCRQLDVAEQLLQGFNASELEQLSRDEAMQKIAELVGRIDQAKASNPRLAALLDH
jgi:hypothetical protein